MNELRHDERRVKDILYGKDERESDHVSELNTFILLLTD